MLNYMMSGGLQRHIKLYGTSMVFLHYGSDMTNTIKRRLIFENDQGKDIYAPNIASFKRLDKAFQEDEKKDSTIKCYWQKKFASYRYFKI